MKSWRGRMIYVVPLLATVLGLVAAGAVWARESSQSHQRDMRAANQVATAISRSAGINVDGLRGASTMVVDDEQVSQDELDAFARELLEGSQIRVIAVARPVVAADRARFEADQHEITETGPGRQQVRAANRARYLPIVAASTRDPTLKPNIGFDLLSDPARAAAVRIAEQRHAPSLSEPLALVPTGREGYLAVNTLRTLDGRVVGDITAVFAIDDVVDSALATLDGHPRVAVYDGGARVSGDLAGGAAANLRIANRTLVVRADDGTSTTLWPALAIALGALLAGIALTIAIWRLRRSERAASALADRLDRDRTGAMRLADLGRRLTMARTRDDVVALVGEDGAAVVGADRADMAFVEGHLLRTATRPHTDGAVLVPLDTHLPRTEAVGTAAVVTVEDVVSYQQGHPDLAEAARAEGVRSEAAIPLIDADGTPFGVLDLVWPERQTFAGSGTVRLTTLGALVAGTLQRVDAVGAEVRRAERLAQFTQRLAVAATATDVVAVVAADAARLVGADAVDCAVVDASGCLAATRADSLVAGADPLVAGADEAIERALGGQDLAVVSVGHDLVRFAALPLRAGQRVRGAMRVTWSAPAALDVRTRATLRTVADLTAQALVRAQSTDDTVRHADGLARLAEQLAVASSLDQVAAAAADYLPTISDAADVHLAVEGELAATGQRHALTDVSGDTVGELVVAWPATPDAEQQERLRTAIALIDDTVRRVDIQRSTSQTLLSLRQRLLRPLPAPSGLELAARYRPTVRPLGMGGDWYDVVERRDGTVAIVIGDVVGHGIPAIATMIHLSTILGGLVRSATPPEELIARATAMLDSDGMVATAQVLVIDPAASTLTMVSAGHPPPLLRSPSGEVVRIAEATHPPLGVGDGSGRVVRVEFPPGAVVLGYTDGLVERRDESLDAGIGRLAAVLAATNGSVWGTVGRVLAAMAPDGAERNDDVAIVVARHRLT